MVSAFARGRRNKTKNMKGNYSAMKSATKIMIAGAALAILISPANAGVVFNASNDISLSVFVPCAAGGAGEIVDLSGPLHTLISFTINGNNLSGVEHFSHKVSAAPVKPPVSNITELGYLDEL